MFTVDESYVYIRFDPFNNTINHIYRKMMSRRGGSGRCRPQKLPGVVAPSKVKRICGAEGCGVQVVGTELPHHYKARTDFKKLGQLRKMATEVAEEELKGLDPHTVYIQCLLIRTICFLLLHNQKVPLKCRFCNYRN